MAYHDRDDALGLAEGYLILVQDELIILMQLFMVLERHI
jgi:hypothetical protein